MLSDVNNSSTIGILCDESTDIANLKQLVVFAKYLVTGLPQTSFLKVVSLQDRKAETILRISNDLIIILLLFYYFKNSRL